ncbi:MAG: YibE/F family protein [Gudongella sp.]|jgi:uncharacterized membrane protein|nr:YibE/F family protein [Gudongella sp.]
MKKITTILAIVLIFLTSTAGFAADMMYDDELDFENFIEKGTVLEADDPQEREDQYFKSQYVTMRIDSGPHKGDIVYIENALSDHQYYDIIVKKGMKVSVMIEQYDDGSYQAYVADYYRVSSLTYLLVAFIILVLIIARFKGLKALISLGITIAAVLFIMLPLMLKGWNPITVSVITAVTVTIITMVLVSGINHKTTSAILGTSFGVIIAGLIAFYVGNNANLSGLTAEEATMLMFIPQGIEFNFRQLLFAGIIMGSLGAAMDVGISIASSIEEIHKANPRLSSTRLFRAGMNVGKDVMGTMVNTLILAYTGTSIPMLLLFMAYETELAKVFNLDIIATEVVRSLAGSIGLILTIPITAFFASRYTKRQKDRARNVLSLDGEGAQVEEVTE